MHNIDWAHWGRVAVWAVIGVVLYVAFVLWIARKVHEGEQELLRREELARLHAAMAEADAKVEAARNNVNRIVREAEKLGFFDGLPPKAA